MMSLGSRWVVLPTGSAFEYPHALQWNTFKFSAKARRILCSKVIGRPQTGQMTSFIDVRSSLIAHSWARWLVPAMTEINRPRFPFAFDHFRGSRCEAGALKKGPGGHMRKASRGRSRKWGARRKGENFKNLQQLGERVLISIKPAPRYSPFGRSSRCRIDEME
jgi:hypothetical protein